MRSSLSTAPRGHTVSRRYAAEGCADAQDTLRKDGERIMINRPTHSASSFEQLAGRRAGQKDGCKAAGARTAAAEAAVPAGGCRCADSQQCGSVREQHERRGSHFLLLEATLRSLERRMTYILKAKMSSEAHLGFKFSSPAAAAARLRGLRLWHEPTARPPSCHPHAYPLRTPLGLCRTFRVRTSPFLESPFQQRLATF